MKKIKQAMYLPFCIVVLFSTCSEKQNPSTQDIPVLINEIMLKDINPSVKVGSPVELNVSDNNDKYVNIIKTEFNTGQSLWYARGGWRTNGSFNFTRLNTTINWLKDNGLDCTVHMLAGQDLFMPDWLTKRTWDSTALDSMLRHMIYSVMDANDNKNKVEIWNVINEVIDDDGCYRTNIVWNQMGWEADSSELTGNDKINEKHPVFIRKAFNYCREKTGKKLELRDYNIESNNPAIEDSKKHKGFYQLAKHLRHTKVPLDAIGIQGHIQVGKSNWRLENNTLKETIAKFKALDVEVYITELDAGIDKLTWSESVALKQKEDYYNYVKQAIEGGASRIYLWGIQDGMDKGWLPNEYPLPWDKNLERKPAYDGIKQALIDTKKN